MANGNQLIEIEVLPTQDDCIQKVARFKHVLGASLIFNEVGLGVAHRGDEIDEIHI